MLLQSSIAIDTIERPQQMHWQEANLDILYLGCRHALDNGVVQISSKAIASGRGQRSEFKPSRWPHPAAAVNPLLTIDQCIKLR